MVDADPGSASRSFEKIEDRVTATRKGEQYTRSIQDMIRDLSEAMPIGEVEPVVTSCHDDMRVYVLAAEGI